MKRLLMVTLLAALACGGDSPMEPELPDASGLWDGSLVRVWGGELTGSVHAVSIEITERPNGLTGLALSTLMEDQVFTGSRDGNEIRLILSHDGATFQLHHVADSLYGTAVLPFNEGIRVFDASFSRRP